MIVKVFITDGQCVDPLTQERQLRVFTTSPDTVIGQTFCDLFCESGKAVDLA